MVVADVEWAAEEHSYGYTIHMSKSNTSQRQSEYINNTAEDVKDTQVGRVENNKNVNNYQLRIRFL